MEDGKYLYYFNLLYFVFIEHFIVWMRTAGLPNFRKLWGRIEPKLITKGKYRVTIQNNYETTAFQGKK